MADHTVPTAAELAQAWAGDPRWAGVRRSYTPQDVARLRGSVQERHTLAERGARRLWELLHDEDYVNALGALTGGQAVQMVRAGLKAIYLSGWQVAADANLAGHTYPDQSLYPANSVPAVVRRINNALLRADLIDTAGGRYERDWLVPIVADAEAGFGGPLRTRKKPSAVRSPVRNGLSRSSTSVVSRSAASASVRATTSVGTPHTSAASRAAFRVRMCCPVGISTLPPR